MKNKVSNPSQSINTESREILATVYRLILKFTEKTNNEKSDPLDNETTGTEHFGEDTEPAEETTAIDAGAL